MPAQRCEDKRVEECASARKRERGRERAPARGVERERKCFGSSFYMFFPPPGPALCKLGLARSAVCSTWGLHSDPGTFLCSIFAGFSLPCLLATAILNSFSLFYLPNTMNCVFSWQNSVSFCPASFYIPRPNLPVTPGISWLTALLLHSSPL